MFFSRFLSGMWFLLCFMFYVTPVRAQIYSAAEEYQVKAAFLYNFTRFIEWPESAFKDSTAPFIIGVVGGDPFNNFLEEVIAGEKVNSHRIKVVHFRNEKGIKDCHLLYFNIKDPDKIKWILQNNVTPYTLTVSDIENFAKLGGHIRFYKEQDRIRLLINMETTKSTRLIISSKLLKVAKIYDL